MSILTKVHDDYISSGWPSDPMERWYVWSLLHYELEQLTIAWSL